MGFGLKIHFDRRVTEKRDNSILFNLDKTLNDEKTILDVGCGNGRLSKKIEKRFRVKVRGADIALPKKPAISVTLFDGKTLPFPENSFDAVFLIDVLHHTKNPNKLFYESLRVAKKSVFVKDHYYENNFQKAALMLADFIGNFQDKVSTPFCFLTKNEWGKMLKSHKYDSLAWHSLIVPGIQIPQIIFRVSKEQS